MDTNTEVFDLARAATADRARVGGKAGVLGELAAAGLPVLPGLVVTAEALKHDGWECSLEIAAGSLGATRLAVRSSGAAEDLPDASYAGLYETYLNVPANELGEAVRRCFAAAVSDRVTAYHAQREGRAAAMAVLIQPMVDPACAGVAFTAHPITGDRDQTVVTAVAGLGEPLVSGETTGEEWTITTSATTTTRPGPGGDRILSEGHAAVVAQLARRVADRYDGQHQD